MCHTAWRELVHARGTTLYTPLTSLRKRRVGGASFWQSARDHRAHTELRNSVRRDPQPSVFGGVPVCTPFCSREVTIVVGQAPDNGQGRGQGRFAGRCWRVLLRAVLQELSWRYTLWHLLLGLHAVWLPLRPHIPSRRARLLLHPGLRRVRLPVQQDGQARPANSSSVVHVRFHSDGKPEGACHGSEALVQKDVLGRRDS